jgi:2-polyprenyl-6-hydroxyphenyl methylase/3-demethylubiquinone-9 3-methyltransferase
MGDYYARKLSGRRLRRCYELAPPRVQQYLEAEIEFVLTRIKAGARLLELGCGYGRVLYRLARRTKNVVGIDTSAASLALAREMGGDSAGKLLLMNALTPGFVGRQFDRVICIQNGLAAFGVDRPQLIQEACRITRPGGLVLFSSYAEKFWPDRLAWFRIQAGHGLIGEIDEQATGQGMIVCRDGFKAGTVGPAEFAGLAARLGLETRSREIDGSSIFFEIQV